MSAARQTRRPPKRQVNGVLMIDKPVGLTSNGVLGVIKRLFSADKAGHTGTLDPFATGLLPVALGEATKFSGRLIEADKTYLATMRLGVTTTTGDLEGDVTETRAVDASTGQIARACAKFTGPIEQIPPMYSALKRDGKPLYEYARAGIEIERSARSVTIHSIDLVAHQADHHADHQANHQAGHQANRQADHQAHDVVFRVACSKGTYIRTLAEDIGRELDCGAHLIALRRERTGGFGLEKALTLDAIEALAFEARDALLLPVDTLITDLPRIDCSAADAARLRLGQKLSMHSLGVSAEGLYRVYDEAAALTGLVQAISGALKPERLVAQGSPAST